MKFDGRYPALALALGAGEALGIALGGMGTLAPFALGCAALVIFCGYGFGWRLWPYCAMALVGLSLAWASEARRSRALDEAALKGLFVREVTVEHPSEAETGTCMFDAESDGLKLRFVIPSAALSPRPAAGERWRIAGWLERKDFGDHSRRRVFVRGRGTFAARLEPAKSPRRFFLGVRHALGRNLTFGIDPEGEGATLLKAIFLGEKSRFPRHLRGTFAAAGTIHIFAISGLHVGVLAWVLVVFSRLCYCPLRFVALAAIPLLWFYVLTIGAPPSAVRAAGMASLMILAPLVWRKADALCAWSEVFIIAHVLDPQLLADVGSLLSFTVMLAILAWYRFVGRGISLAAWAAGVPIVAHVFGTFTLAGLLANLFLVPLAGITVALAVAGSLFGFVSVTLAAHVNVFAAAVVEAMIAISSFFASLPYASVEVGRWSCAMGFGWYAALALVMVMVALVRSRRLEIWH